MFNVALNTIFFLLKDVSIYDKGHSQSLLLATVLRNPDWVCFALRYTPATISAVLTRSYGGGGGGGGGVKSTSIRTSVEFYGVQKEY